MSTPRPDTIETLAELTAVHVTGQSTTDDDGVLSFWIEDGEDAVDIRHEIGDPEEAARALYRLADEIRKHADLIRSRARLRTAAHGPLTGPTPWPRG